MFLEDNDVSISLPIGYEKSLIYQAAPVIDHLSSSEETVTMSIVPPVKALAEDQVHYLNVFRPKGLSAFNLRSLCERCCEAIKYVSGCRTLSHLINLKVVVSCSDSFD